MRRVPTRAPPLAPPKERSLRLTLRWWPRARAAGVTADKLAKADREQTLTFVTGHRSLNIRPAVGAQKPEAFLAKCNGEMTNATTCVILTSPSLRCLICKTGFIQKTICIPVFVPNTPFGIQQHPKSNTLSQNIPFYVQNPKVFNTLAT
ncbi:unnamed protein product [Rangifer tarandus platyrhynchus]|uniref:Uncharacterized protein n=2 Tax=Rangifer tarandus platyrhynchus TaxID=3082113 RepID=A0ACB0FID5_RANTA|nr:unnamed protein product [Rangifer tarandus platyrhynchus]CAI9712492.1 unnamed protein product [Rangifer tarandus platyrhynchus]